MAETLQTVAGAESADVGAAAEPRDETLVEAFGRMVRAFPSRIALSSDTLEATYSELDTMANRWAHRLLALGGRAGDRAAILMAHDTPAIAAVLAVIKAGRIAVPLGSADPAARLQTLVDECDPAVIICDAANRDLAARLAGTERRVLGLAPSDAGGPAHDPALPAEPGDVAFLNFTSGTTGRPNAVMATHRQVRWNALVHTEAMLYRETDRMPLFAALGSGQGINAPWCALANGATLCPFPVTTRGVAGLADWIIARALTVYISSASIFRALMQTVADGVVFENIRAVRLASEAASHGDFAAFRRHFPPGCLLVHTLSCSECGSIAWARWTAGDDVGPGTLPVGRIARGMTVAIEGEDGSAARPGEIGEIVVTSRYVAAGYWRDPALTARHFSRDLDAAGTRRFRTGDLGRINARDLLEVRGRADDRVKIRGHRIELADVEQALAKLPGIARAAAVTLPRERLEPLLAAFVATDAGTSWPAPRLRQALAAHLPHHMVPSRFVFVDDLPYGPGGKVDREALRRHRLARTGTDACTGPLTATETLVADIWAELFDLDRVARDDDFFTLGGDSLCGAIVAAQIHAALNIMVDLATIARCPTVRELACFIDGRDAPPAGALAIERVRRDMPAPQSFTQERMWRFCQTPSGRSAYTHANVQIVTGPLDVEALRECLAYLIRRHDILRTTFAELDARPVQIVHPSGPLDFAEDDVSSAAEPERMALALLDKEAARPIDPARLPLFRYRLVTVRRDEHWLLRTSGMVADGASWKILLGELSILYEARLRRADPPLPLDIPLHYVDYAAWRFQHLNPEGPRYSEMVDWWRDLLAEAGPATDLPFRRNEPAGDVDPADGVLLWQLEGETDQRLDRLARTAGATFFVVRLAACAALLAEESARARVVIGTYVMNRNFLAVRDMVGPFANLAPLALSCDPDRTFTDWIAIVREHVFDIENRSDIPFERLCAELARSGLAPPDIRIIFAMASNHSSQPAGEVTFTYRVPPIAAMPWECTIYVDEQAPDACRTMFDAGLYDRDGMAAFMDRYVRLLDAAALRPDLAVGELLRRSRPARRFAGVRR
jgi:amino acid adenylation domain-containing protein